MKVQNIIILLFIIGFSTLSYGQNEESLIPVYENNRWGFIDAKGDYVIKPRFYSIGKFSSNLAPVREDNLFGYINTSGKFIIPSKYDFALPFIDNLAKVYIKGKPFFIDKSGNIIFQHDFIEFHTFEGRNVTFALAKNEKYAVVNRSGEVLIEPIFEKVSHYTNGLAVVKMPSDDESSMFYGVLDAEGQYLVDFGEYDKIEPYVNGYAKVWIYDDSYLEREMQGVIDENGELIFTVTDKDWSFSNLRGDFTEGVAIIDLMERNVEKNDLGIIQKPRMGIINEAGELILEGEDIKEITYFNYNRAFVRKGDNKWYLIDKQGNIIKDDLPGGLLENKIESNETSLPFLNGIEILETPKGLVLIDTTGNAIYPARTFGRRVVEKKRAQNILFYKEDIFLDEGYYAERWGFWDLEKNILTKPKFNRYLGFTPSGLIHVIKDNEECIVDRTGRVVWIQRNKDNKVAPMSIDYMLNGYFYVNSISAHKKEYSVLGGGGYSLSGELPNENTKKHKFPENRFSLIVRTNERTNFKNHIAGYKTYIVNSTENTVYFQAEDSRLKMLIEALNENGNWQNIEHLPESFCGHSPHILDLPANHHWELKIPQYAGAFKTKLRVKLVYKIDLESNKTAVIYSNEFNGSINPAQFWRKKGSFSNMPKD